MYPGRRGAVARHVCEPTSGRAIRSSTRCASACATTSRSTSRWCAARSPPTWGSSRSSTATSARSCARWTRPGSRDSTRVVYTTDHGDNLGTRGMWGKSTMYEESAGIPLILAGPDVPQATSATRRSRSSTAFPTFVHALGRAARRARRRAARPFAARHRARLRAEAHDPLRIPRRRRADRLVHDPPRQVQVHPLRRVAADAVRPRSAIPLERDDLGRDPAFASVVRECEARLRTVVDPEAADRQARADQQQQIEKFGGKEAILEARHVPVFAAAGPRRLLESATCVSLRRRHAKCHASRCASTSSPTTSGTPSAGTFRAAGACANSSSFSTRTSCACRSCGRCRAISSTRCWPITTASTTVSSAGTARATSTGAIRMFAEIEHGAEDVEIKDTRTPAPLLGAPPVEAARAPVLVATAHLTHQRHPDESEDRPVAARRRDQAHHRRARAPERASASPLFFMGDLNDPVHPPTLLHEAGYVSCFAALGLQPPPTFKCYPTADVDAGQAVDEPGVDWIVANEHARPLAAVRAAVLLRRCGAIRSLAGAGGV